jgi:hypothetical protein
MVATVEANGNTPTGYLADVLFRMQSHTVSRIDELLPQNWLLPGVPDTLLIAQAPAAT